MFQTAQIDAIRSAILVADTPVAAESLDWCRSMRNRRRQRSSTQLPSSALYKLKLWVANSTSSLLLAQGRGVTTSALDFAADFIDIVIDHDYPVIWALPSIVVQSSEMTQPVSLSGVLRSLISQILTANPDLTVEGINPLTVRHFQSAMNTRQWFDIFDRCITSATRLFVVIDMSLIEIASQHDEAEAQFFGKDEFIEQMIGILSRKVAGSLKIIIASLDSEEVVNENHIWTDRGRRVEMMKRPRLRGIDRGKQRQTTAMLRSSMA